MKKVVLTWFLLNCIFAQQPLHFNVKQNGMRELGEKQTQQSTINNLQWSPIKIELVYINPPTSQSKCLKKLFETASLFFERHLLIRKRFDSFYFDNSFQGQFTELKIPLSYIGTQFNAYLVIFVTFYNSDEESTCGFFANDKDTLRPVGGFINWNIAESSCAQMTNEKFDENISKILHKMFHVLGFAREYLQNFYDSSTGLSYSTSSIYKQNNIIYINTPRLLKLAKQHFNCQNITGIQTEDQGGDLIEGSHFERTWFYNEIMTKLVKNAYRVISDFSFQFLQDTGFYRIMEYSPDQFLWGKNKGCPFTDSFCQGGNFTEFCYDQDTKGCSYYKRGQSTCQSDEYSNSCFYQVINVNDCRNQTISSTINPSESLSYFGYDSMCVQSNVQRVGVNATSNSQQEQFGCYQYLCDENNKLSVIIDNVKYSCNNSEVIHASGNYSGSFYCPDNYDTYCQATDECKDYCNQRGICMNKQCLCNVGYSGNACQDTCDAYRYKNMCVQNCPQNTYLLPDIKVCVGCPANCQTCDNYNKCQRCQNGYYLRYGFCDNFYDQYATNTSSDSNSSNSTNNTSVQSYGQLLIFAIVNIIALQFIL